MDIKKFTDENLDTVAAFIAHMQQDTTHHIPYFGETAPDIAASIQEWENWQNLILLGYDGDQLIGFLGADVGTELQRAWIHGPFIDHTDWHNYADEIYQAALEQIIPDGLKSYEVLGDVRNTNLKAFAQRHHFDTIVGAACLGLKRDQITSLPDLPTASPMTPQQYAAFVDMHNSIFPNTYYTGQELVDQLDEQHKAFVITEGDQLQGYIFAKLDNGGEGYIEFLGVAEDARGKGLGTRLIATATRWLMDFPQAQTVDLTVNDDNEKAIRLYKHIGFEHILTMQAYRKFF